MKKIFLFFAALFVMVSGYAQNVDVTFNLTVDEDIERSTLSLGSASADPIIDIEPFWGDIGEATVSLPSGTRARVYVLAGDDIGSYEMIVTTSNNDVIKVGTSGSYFMFPYTPTSTGGIVDVVVRKKVVLPIYNVNIQSATNCLLYINDILHFEGAIPAFNSGTELVVKVVPFQGYSFEDLFVGGVSVELNANNEYTFTLNASTIISAICVKRQSYTVSCNPGQGGSVTLESTSITEGDKAKFTFYPDNGKRVASAIFDGYEYKNNIVDNFLEIEIFKSGSLYVTWEDIPLTARVNGTYMPSDSEIRNFTQVELNGTWTQSEFTAFGSVLNKSSNLKKVIFGSDFDVANTPDLSTLFSGCVNLESVESALKTANYSPFKMTGTFVNCTSLKTVSLSYLDVVGLNGAFVGCSSMTSLVLERTTGLSATYAFSNVNPNCLVYVKGGVNSFPQDWRNNVLVIFNGTAQYSYVLDASKPFNCPTAFSTGNNTISYKRKFLAATAAGTGWETITLPFAPSSITAVIGGDGSTGEATEIEHFTYGQASGAHFWVREYNGFESNTLLFDDVNSFSANTPYNIAMPGASFGEQHRLDNRPVVFSVSNGYVPQTGNLTVSKNGVAYVGTYSTKSMDKSQYTLSSTGASFVNAGTRNSECFKGYIDGGASLNGVALKISTSSSVGTSLELIRDELVGSRDIEKVYATKGAIMVEATKSGTLLVHNINGMLVNQPEVTEGLNRISVAAGTYLINGSKVVVY